MEPALLKSITFAISRAEWATGSIGTLGGQRGLMGAGESEFPQSERAAVRVYFVFTKSIPQFAALTTLAAVRTLTVA